MACGQESELHGWCSGARSRTLWPRRGASFCSCFVLQRGVFWLCFSCTTACLFALRGARIIVVQIHFAVGGLHDGHHCCCCCCRCFAQDSCFVSGWRSRRSLSVSGKQLRPKLLHLILHRISLGASPLLLTLHWISYHWILQAGLFGRDHWLSDWELLKRNFKRVCALAW